MPQLAVFVDTRKLPFQPSEPQIGHSKLNTLQGPLTTPTEQLRTTPCWTRRKEGRRAGVEPVRAPFDHPTTPRASLTLRPPPNGRQSGSTPHPQLQPRQHQAQARNRPSWRQDGTQKGRGAVVQICAICRHKADFRPGVVDLQHRRDTLPSTRLHNYACWTRGLCSVCKMALPKTLLALHSIWLHQRAQRARKTLFAGIPRNRAKLDGYAALGLLGCAYVRFSPFHAQEAPSATQRLAPAPESTAGGFLARGTWEVRDSPPASSRARSIRVTFPLPEG